MRKFCFRSVVCAAVVALAAVLPQMAMGGDLPSDYIALTYVEATGAQYVDTGYVPNANTKIEATFAAQGYSGSSNRAYLFGCYGGNNAGRCQFAYGKTELFQGWGGEYSTGYTVTGNYDVHTMVLDKGAFTLDGTATYSVSSWSGTSVKLALFSSNGNGTINTGLYAYMRLYSLTISEDGVAKRTFVPALRASDSVAGLYDTANGKFYTSSTSTALVAAPLEADIPTYSAFSVAGNATKGMWASITVKDGTTADTKVTCYLGESADALTAVETWDHTETPMTYAATNATVEVGKAYYGAFRISYTYEEETRTIWTSTNSVTITGNDYWIGESGAGWNVDANWDLGKVPNSGISAYFTNTTTAVAGPVELATKGLYATKGKVVWTFDPATTINFTYLHVGAGTTTAKLFVTNGSLNASGSMSFDGAASVYTQSGARSRFPEGVTFNNMQNAAIDLEDGAYMSTKLINLDARLGTVTVGPDSSLFIWADSAGLSMSGDSATVLVDGGSVTNSSTISVSQQANKTACLRVANGGTYVQAGGSFNVGVRGSGRVYVTDGATLCVTNTPISLGMGSDSYGASSWLDVTNATVKCKTLCVARDTRYPYTYTTRVIGADARLDVTGNAYLGAIDYYGGRNRVNDKGTAGEAALYVDEGTVTIGGTLNVGTQYERTTDRVSIGGATAKVSAGAVACTTNALIKFDIPENGFSNEGVIEATGAIAFAEASDKPIRIDASDCRSSSWQTLLKAGSKITNLATNKVQVVATYKNRPYDLELTTDANENVTALKFRIHQSGMVIFCR